MSYYRTALVISTVFIAAPVWATPIRMGHLWKKTPAATENEATAFTFANGRGVMRICIATDEDEDGPDLDSNPKDGRFDAGARFVIEQAAREWGEKPQWPHAGEDQGNQIVYPANEALGASQAIMTDGAGWRLRELVEQRRRARSYSAAEKTEIAAMYFGNAAFPMGFTIEVIERTTSAQCVAAGRRMVVFHGSRDMKFEPDKDRSPRWTGRSRWSTGITVHHGYDSGTSTKAIVTIADDPSITDFDEKVLLKRKWFYARDTHRSAGRAGRDGRITNADARPGEGEMDYYTVLKHEMGHAFGLSHPTNDPPAVWGVPTTTLGLGSGSDDTAAQEEGGGLGTAPIQLYFASDRPGGFGGLDVWSVPWTGNGWGTAVNLGSGVNTAADESDPYPVSGQAALVFASNRGGNFDLYVSRIDDTDAWTAAQALDPTLNTAAAEFAPVLSRDLKTIYFSSDRAGGAGGVDVWSASRSDPFVSFGPPVAPGPGFNSSADDAYPALSSGEDALYFASTRPGGSGGVDLWRSLRNGSVWDAPANLGASVNSSADDTAPSIAADELTLHFASNRAGGAGGLDLYEALNVLDSDGDGIGDVNEGMGGTDPADSDSDDDGFSDFVEEDHGSNPLDAASTPESLPISGTCSDALDNDGDGHMDAADAACDGDGDGTATSEDNCPTTANPSQADADGDELGDDCDSAPANPDMDGDGVLDGFDVCPAAVDPAQEDDDGDGAGDECDPDDDNDSLADGSDNCPFNTNLGQDDLDGDLTGDACDEDVDEDGFDEWHDNCPAAANGSQTDTDADGTGDACDPCSNATTAKVLVRKLNTPAGDDKLLLKADVQLPAPVSPALDPAATGVRVVLDDNGGNVLDLTIPPGLYADPPGMGWRVLSSGKWTWTNRVPASTAGLFKMKVKDLSANSPGRVKILAKGKNGDYDLPGGLPLTGRVFLVPPTDQCMEAEFSPSSCVSSASGSTVKCK